MKKVALYILAFFLLLPCSNVVAQEKSDLASSLMVWYSPFDGSGKVITETTALGNNHVGYAYAELTGLRGGGAEGYGQFFWEQKFWDKPIFIHAEYRAVAADSFYESTAFIGAAYCIYSKHGYLALEPLAMWKQGLGFGGQFSVVGGWEWKYFILEHYTDLWKTHKMSAPIDIYSQTRLFVKVYKRLSAGVVGTIYYTPGNTVSAGAYLALRWRF
ncbi:MAG: hypothetical protein IIV04_00470 [Bacteroidaceae bacterium]|nr:hypothetical protein [Bacteroidaceae bacterium]